MVNVVSGARAVIEHARTVLTAWHKVLAKFGWLAPVYLKLVASVCRTFLAFRQQRVSDNRSGDLDWPKATAFRLFFRPEGHLINGSLIEPFARFSDAVEKRW